MTIRSVTPKYDQSVEIYQKSPDANSEIRYDINSAFHSYDDNSANLYNDNSVGNRIPYFSLFQTLGSNSEASK